MTPEMIFVFGTLKEGFPNFAKNQGQRVPGNFETVLRLPLYLVGKRHSPWLVQDPGQGLQVLGQVFSVSAEALGVMDQLERVTEPDGYRRVRIDVQRTDSRGALLQVHAYLKPRLQLQAEQIKAGPLREYTLAHSGWYRQRGQLVPASPD